MQSVLIIDTGGTFNKIYNPLNGKLEVNATSKASREIAQKWLYELEVVSIIGKDSLDIDDGDRVLLLATINLAKHQKIIIIHGTDTMDITAKYLADASLDRSIILTGAMVPYSIDPIEATANLASAYGYINSIDSSGVYVSMNGIIGEYSNIVKDRQLGRFVAKDRV
ncbi:asparaginase [hydrothermal vent metagenome]|uniref:Asparaginase n=1 Tax=hydrothermal vent metagenome TaxID=652676 RepID=A0A1W1C3Y6_9ZZZZ